MTDRGDDRLDPSGLGKSLRLLATRTEPLVRVAPVADVIRRGRRRRTRRRATVAAAVAVATLLTGISVRVISVHTQHDGPAGPGTVQPTQPPPTRPGARTSSAGASPTATASASPRPTTRRSASGDKSRDGTPAGSPGAPLTPAGLRLLSLGEQDGEALALGFDTGGNGSRALTAYRAQLTRAGWKAGAHQALKGGATITYDIEGDGSLAVFTSQVRIPDLTFRRSAVEGGKTHYYFSAAGKPHATADYQAKLTKLGFRVKDLGGAEEAVHGSTNLHFGVDNNQTVWVSVEKLG